MSLLAVAMGGVPRESRTDGARYTERFWAASLGVFLASTTLRDRVVDDRVFRRR
jgi:hypothetical protein